MTCSCDGAANKFIVPSRFYRAFDSVWIFDLMEVIPTPGRCHLQGETRNEAAVLTRLASRLGADDCIFMTKRECEPMSHTNLQYDMCQCCYGTSNTKIVRRLAENDAFWTGRSHMNSYYISIVYYVLRIDFLPPNEMVS